MHLCHHATINIKEFPEICTHVNSSIAFHRDQSFPLGIHPNSIIDLEYFKSISLSMYYINRLFRHKLRRMFALGN